MSQYHKDTYEYLTREVYIARCSRPTDVYLDRLWHSLDHCRPDIDALIDSLQCNIQTRTNDIEQYSSDVAHVLECRTYIQQHQHWIDRCAALSLRAAENEIKTNAILKKLDQLSEDSEQREQERERQREAKQDTVQMDLFSVA